MEINGKKVVDAKSRATIKITQRDVTEGDNKNPSGCAAAIAAKRLDDCISARVHIGRVYIEQKDRWVRYETPDSLRTEIISFDRGGIFDPGEYTLLPPIPAEVRARNRHIHTGSETNRNNNNKKPRRMLHVAKIKRHEVTGIRPKGGNR